VEYEKNELEIEIKIKEMPWNFVNTLLRKAFPLKAPESMK
jgi:hypothetical protein